MSILIGRRNTLTHNLNRPIGCRLVYNNKMVSPKSAVKATGVILLCNARHMLLTRDNRGVKIREATTTSRAN